MITGLWRGLNGISANQLIHITGLDDFEIERIELIRPPNKRSMDEESIIQLIRNEDIAVSIMCEI